jgi:2-polyprenyl-3-methyl-5-hydroxy-6-metoxy-1,4-benzoquinol methylase
MNKNTKLTIETYDKIASNYNVTKTSKLRQWIENSMDIFVNYVTERRVLVIACGDGRDSKYLSSKNLTVTSIDLSKGMLNEAIKNDPLGTYKLFDLRNIDKLKAQFDGIWASGCLYHLTKNEFSNFLKKAKTVLREDGILYLNMKEGSGDEYLDEPKSSQYPGGIKSKKLLTGTRFYSYYSHEELITYLNGYEIVKERRLKYAEKGFEFWCRNCAK